MDIQLDLFLDYANNIKLYPAFHECFRKSQPLLLAIWGRDDPFFIPAGAEAHPRDNPNATVNFSIRSFRAGDACGGNIVRDARVSGEGWALTSHSGFPQNAERLRWGRFIRGGVWGIRTIDGRGSSASRSGGSSGAGASAL
jgi:hypothetical protein